MKIFKPKQKISCVYCKEKTPHPASYYVPTVGNCCQRETCGHCDQEFLVRKLENGMIATTNNWSEKEIYSCP